MASEEVNTLAAAVFAIEAIGSERAGVWCARSPQDFGQIFGKLRRHIQLPLGPARQVGDVVGSRRAQRVG
jgi:hypothetical protein